MVSKTQIIWLEPDPEVRRGRKLIGSRAMTNAERSARKRAKSNPIVLKRKIAETDKYYGSLTAHLKSKESPVRCFIEKEFPHLRDLSRELNLSLSGFQKLAHERNSVKYLYTLAGTAIDYRIRIYFSDRPQDASVILKGMSSLDAISEISKNGERTRNPWSKWNARGRGKSNLHRFISAFERFLKKTRPVRRRLSRAEEEKLCRYCVLLARIGNRHSVDYLMKLGKTDVNSMLRKMESNVVEDVMNLSTIFYSNNKKLIGKFSNAYVGKPLGGYRDVLAEFDLIIDGCLFEFKTTIRPKISVEFLRQIVGYFLLDYADEYRMRKAAIYLTRQGHTCYLDIRKDLLQSSQSIQEIRASFKAALVGHI